MNTENKVLFVASIDRHILSFHTPYLKLFKDEGYEVHVASNGTEIIPFVDKKYNVEFERSPFKTSNIKAYFHLKRIIEENNYDLIHCHTPMASALTRIAARAARQKAIKVVYTAHGFHFFKGAPLKNWLIYYPIEKILSKYTDCIITINSEDYKTAINKNFKARKIVFVNGLGVDLEKYPPRTFEQKSLMREKYCYSQDDFILFFAAELSYRKHQDLLINAVNLLKKSIPNIKLLLAGSGPLEKQYKEQTALLGLDSNVKFLGYRKDVKNYLILSDIAVASARQEGLPVNLMEAMATGLPLVVTDARGNRDLVVEGENGLINDLYDQVGFANSIEKLYKNKNLREFFGQQNIKLVRKYSIKNVLQEMKTIYREVLNFR